MLDKATNTVENELKLNPKPVKPIPLQKITPELPSLEEIVDHSTDSLQMICPICCRNFNSNTDFEAFHSHVEDHFTDTDTFELL